MIESIKALLRCDCCQRTFTVDGIDPAAERSVMSALSDACFQGSALSDERGELCEVCYEKALLAMPDDADTIEWPEPIADDVYGRR